MNTHKFLDIISYTFLSITLLLMAATSGYVENLVSGKRFVFEMAGIGFLIASLWMYILYKLHPSYFDGGEKRAGAILGQFFSIVILTIFLSTLYNYKSGLDNLSRQKVIVLDKSKNIYKGTTYVSLFIHNKKERFNPRGKDFENLVPGDTIEVLIGKGALNWEFIYDFQPGVEKN